MKIYALLVFPLVVLGFFVIAKTIHAQSQTVSATVRIPVCGDGVAESPEECDNSDLDSQTCVSLGYGPGTLSCDIGCDFDTSGCTTPSPTPTPTVTPLPTSTPQPTSTPTTTSSSSSSPSSSPSSSSNDNIVSTPLVDLISQIRPNLPSVVSVYDLNDSRKIELSELYDATLMWVTHWHDYSMEGKFDTCDLDDSGSCNIVDFSILMYYINR